MWFVFLSISWHILCNTVDNSIHEALPRNQSDVEHSIYAAQAV